MGLQKVPVKYFFKTFSSRATLHAMPSKTTNRLRRTRGADHVETPLVPVAKRRRGRPEIELEPEMLAVADYMARQGATVPEIAEELGVSPALLYTWYAKYPEFLEAVKGGRIAFDQRVLSALGQRAVGYSYETEKVFSNGFRAKVVEHVPADVGAAINWLVNRHPGWRRGDNVAQDAVDAVAPLAGALPDTRQLAMAALALLVGASAPQQTIDVTPTDTSYDTMGEEPDFDDRDPDFDL
jgi:AcrR family transcriptional regulator